MKKFALLFVIILGFFSCKTLQEKTNEKINEEMVSVVEKYFVDSAFADNDTIKFYNCDLIKCDTINENIYDTTVLKTLIGEGPDTYYSQVKDEVQKNKNPLPIYQLKMFIKASKRSKNILDTMTVFLMSLNNKLRVVNSLHSDVMENINLK